MPREQWECCEKWWCYPPNLGFKAAEQSTGKGHVQNDHDETNPHAYSAWGLFHGSGLAYFHIQIAPHHRLFLRFAFKGFTYESKVLLFGLPLAPHTFTKCMNAA